MLPSFQIKLIAVAVAAAGLVYGGYRVGAGLTEAKYLKAAQARQSNVEQQRYKRAKVITHIVTSPVREKVIREVSTNPVFLDASCDVGPSGLRVLDEAFGIKPRSPRGGELPAVDGDH